MLLAMTLGSSIINNSNHADPNSRGGYRPLLSKLAKNRRACPSPFGRRWPREARARQGEASRKAPDEGGHAENPHPALRATLSRRERDTPLHDGQTEIH